MVVLARNKKSQIARFLSVVGYSDDEGLKYHNDKKDFEEVYMSTSFSQFLEALGAFESGINPTQQYGAYDLDWLNVFDPDKGAVDRSSVDLTSSEDLSSLQYHVHNTLGFLGK